VNAKKIDLTPLRHTCKYCGQEKKLIDAHIIPEAFFRPLLNEKDPPQLMTNIGGIFPKRVRKGIYDKTILCRECEDNFAPWDDYAQSLLLQRLKDTRALWHGGEIAGLAFPNYDYTKLKLFFISVLWRASVSTQRFYEKIQLGPFEPCPDAYEFAKGKPLTLLNGSNLLHLLEKHSYKAIIDLKAARKILSEKERKKELKA
jgi:hypothetical protein